MTHIAAKSALMPWMILLIVVAALGVFANSLPNAFALDDVGIIENHPSVQDLEWGRIWAENYWPSPEGPPDVLYRPLTILTYLVNHALAPAAKWAYHAVNIVLHALVCVLLAMLAARLTGNRWVAFLTGLLFAMHPLHTEVVANVVGRAELLAAMWSCLLLLIYLPAGDVLSGPGPRRNPLHGLLVGACFLLALLCKETPAALLLGVVALDVWRWSHWDRNGRPTLWRWLFAQGIRYYVPLLLALGIYLAMRMHAVGLMANTRACHPIVNPLVEATIPQRLVTPFMLLAKYFSLTFWPARLVSDYSAPSLMPTANLAHPQVLMGLMITAVGGLIVAGRWRTWPRAALLVLLFVASYALVANFLRIGTIFGERLFYWPSAFVLMLVSLALVRGWDAVGALPTCRILRTAGAVALTVACVAMSVRTIVRNPDWKDNIHLALATAADNPGSAKACFWAGSILIHQQQQPAWVSLAVWLLEESVRMRPDYGAAHFELAKYYGRQQQFAKSYLWLCQSARWQSGTQETRLVLQAVKDDLKKQKPESYLPAIEEYLRAHPQDPSGYLAKGVALTTLGRLDEAERVLQDGLALAPGFWEMRAEYGLLKHKRGDAEGAVALLKPYVMTVRLNVEARIELARALMDLDPKKFPDAMREAQYNLQRAGQMQYADWRLREAQAQWKRRQAQIQEAAPQTSAGPNISAADLAHVRVNPAGPVGR